jgi:hypothetical protein
MPDLPQKIEATKPITLEDLSGLPSPPDLSLKDVKRSENEVKDDSPSAVSSHPYPTVYPLSPEALALRVQAWVVNPQEPFDKLNRIPQVDLPPENIGYQSPFLPYKGATLKRPI